MPRRPQGPSAISVWLRPAQPGREPARAFSRDQITRVAVELADREGLHAVSMRRIAARIGSAPTSLYWYFSDKNELYELMVDGVIGEIELPGAPSGDWRADLAAIARATHAMGNRHPWLGQLGIFPVPGPSTRRYTAVAMSALEQFELDQAVKINVLATLNNYISGFLQRQAAWQQMTARAEPAGVPPPAVAARQAASDGQDIAQLAARTSLAGDESFEFGLQCLLAGIEQQAGNRATTRARDQIQ